MTIDTHQHFWRYTSAEFDWIDDTMASIRRDFLPSDLLPLLAAAEVDATIAVQARQTLTETEWLLSLAKQHDFVRGVVGWVPLAKDDVEATLQHLTADPKLIGVRHVLQGEPDDRFILGDAFNRGVSLLKKFDLRYDILIVARQLQRTIEFVDRHPDQIFIVDHIAKPQIRAGEIADWRRDITTLAERENVYCKVSGMVTEADYGRWTPDGLKPYFDVVLSAFSPQRMMFGSDWPVCQVAATYERWVQVVRSWTAELSAAERAGIFGQTALDAYGLTEK